MRFVDSYNKKVIYTNEHHLITLQFPFILKPWGHGSIFSGACNATLLHCMRLKNCVVTPGQFFLQCNEKHSKNVAYNIYFYQTHFIIF